MDFCSKCDQFRSLILIWSHLLKKFLVENFILCAVLALKNFWNGCLLPQGVFWRLVLLVITKNNLEKQFKMFTKLLKEFQVSEHVRDSF